MRRTSRLAPLVLAAVLPLTSCTGADESDASKADSPTPQTTQTTESAEDDVDDPTTSDAPASEEVVPVSADTMTAWAKEWDSLERTLAKYVDPKVPTSGLCVALDTPEASWFGLRDVDGDAKAGRVVFGVYPEVGASYSCAEGDAAVVVDLASREPIKGAALFAEIKAAAEATS